MPHSSAIRCATVRAAIRLGWVWAIRSLPASRQIFGSWVVLPDPVSPATTTTWWSRMRDAILGASAEIGSAGSKASRGCGFTYRG